MEADQYHRLPLRLSDIVGLVDLNPNRGQNQ